MVVGGDMGYGSKVSVLEWHKQWFTKSNFNIYPGINIYVDFGIYSGMIFFLFELLI